METEAVADVSNLSVKQPAAPITFAPHNEDLRKQLEALGLGSTCAKNGGLCTYLKGLVQNPPPKAHPPERRALLRLVVNGMRELVDPTVCLVSCHKDPLPRLIEKAKECKFALPNPISPA